MNDYNLFNCIERSYKNDGVQGLPIQQGKRIGNKFKDLVDERTREHTKHESHQQLGAHIANLNINAHQSQELQFFKCDARKNIEASRFNYTLDLMDKRLVDVSGLLIPANMLRNIPNIGIHTMKTNIPFNKDIAELSSKIGNISAEELDRTYTTSKSKNSLRYKANRQKLSREELIGLQKIKRNPSGQLIRNMNPQPQQPQYIPPSSPSSPSPLPTASRRGRRQENIISPPQSVASQQQPRATRREIRELL
jgi:hypothetical protein